MDTKRANGPRCHAFNKSMHQDRTVTPGIKNSGLSCRIRHSLKGRTQKLILIGSVASSKRKTSGNEIVGCRIASLGSCSDVNSSLSDRPFLCATRDLQSFVSCSRVEITTSSCNAKSEAPHNVQVTITNSRRRTPTPCNFLMFQ